MKTILKSLLLVSTMFSLSVTGAADPKDTGVPASYPLKTCVVSGEEFGGDMGKAVKVTYEGTDVYLCCKSCIKKFNKEPAKFVAKVKAAEKK